MAAAGGAEPVASWGGALRSTAVVHRPSTVEGVGTVLRAVAAAGGTVLPRGAGCSYGDAALHPGGALLDLAALDRILEWDPGAGVVVAEPGVTFGALWRRCLPDGWWPPVVPGTAAVTLGGALAANIHGKNAWRAGPIGEHVPWFELMTADGGLRRCTPEGEPELFHAAVGGFGLLGVFTRVALRMRPVATGLLEVRPHAREDLGGLLALVEERAPAAEHMVGWVDALAAGAAAGRGLLHEARHLGAGEEEPVRSLDPAFHAPRRLRGALLSLALRCCASDSGMGRLNALRFAAGRRAAGARREGLPAFSFLLDSLPGWKRAYGPGGLLQFQTLLPAAVSASGFADQLARARAEGLHPWLAVLKRHRRDRFLLTHGVDGHSLALDFRVTAANRERLLALGRALAREAAAAGGRFYLAKDAVLDAATYAASLPPGALDAFRRLKARLDPSSLLRGSLADRLLYGA